MKLVLGVIVTPYQDKPGDAPIPKPKITKSGRLYRATARAAARAFQSPWRHRESGAEDTGTVAEFLEEKYGVMGFFYKKYEAFVAAALADIYRKKLEVMLMGGPIAPSSHTTFLEKVATQFNYFIDRREMDGQVEGVPTKASLDAKTSRFKKGRQKKGPRPSFRDTGNYEGSMRAWVEE
jgi:hypothetical protein